jgi:integrase
MIAILEELDTPTTRLEWMAALLCSATALRPEELFGLQWSDVAWEKNQINVRRAWSKGKETPGKNENSMTQVPLHPALAVYLQQWRRETLHSKDSDWVFASVKAKGKIPRAASTCGKDYLRPAAVKAGVLSKEDNHRFGWHNLRHSLATFLAANDVNLKTAQTILRHKKLSTTADIYTHAVQSNQLAASGQYLDAIKMGSQSIN